MLVFIDESGDTGLTIKKGATKYFIIMMIVFEDNNEALVCDERITLLRRELRLPQNYEFHFHSNSNRVREAFFRAILPYQFFYYGIVINKEKLFGKGFKNKESFYKYAVSLLFENAKEKLERAIIVIDESGRKLFKYKLTSYLRKKLNFLNHSRIYKVKMQNSRGNNLLQLADMISGAVNRSLNKDKKDNQKFRNIIKQREIYVQIWPK